jgi:hypothetical protein
MAVEYSIAYEDVLEAFCAVETLDQVILILQEIHGPPDGTGVPDGVPGGQP